MTDSDQINSETAMQPPKAKYIFIEPQKQIKSPMEMVSATFGNK